MEEEVEEEEEEVACLLISSNCRLFRYLFTVAFDIWITRETDKWADEVLGPRATKIAIQAHRYL